MRGVSGYGEDILPTCTVIWESHRAHALEDLFPKNGGAIEALREEEDARLAKQHRLYERERRAFQDWRQSRREEERRWKERERDRLRQALASLSCHQADILSRQR